MKHSVQSIMTAAMFTAALSTAMRSSADVAALELKTSTMQATLYGPPWVFYDKGDINMDDSIDARDLTLLKRYLIYGGLSPEAENILYPEYLGDMDGDGVISEYDAKAFARQLACKPEQEDELQLKGEPVIVETTETEPEIIRLDGDIAIIETTTETEPEFPIRLEGEATIPETTTTIPENVMLEGQLTIPQTATTTVRITTTSANKEEFIVTTPSPEEQFLIPKESEPFDDRIVPLYGPPNYDFDDDVFN